MSFLNTHKSGSLRSIIFREKGEWFAVALEFNIVEHGDSPEEVMILLDEAVKGYIASAKKAKLSVSVLNQKAAPEYETMWKTSASSQSGKKSQVYRFSSQPLVALMS